MMIWDQKKMDYLAHALCANTWKCPGNNHARLPWQAHPTVLFLDQGSGQGALQPDSTGGIR